MQNLNPIVRIFFIIQIVLLCEACKIPVADKALSQGKRVEIKVRDYGIKANARDNADALMALNDMLKRKPENNWVLIFDSGLYRYSKNNWLEDIGSYELIGKNGTEFQNIYSGPKSEKCYPLLIRTAWRKKDPKFMFNYESGVYFEPQGPSSIKVEQLQNISEDDLILLSGYEQQRSGYPPNARYFDYCRVKSVNRRTGIINLNRQIHTNYDTRWEDYCWGAVGRELCSGKPRLLNLSKSSYAYPETVIIKNINFLANPNCDVRDAVTFAGETVLLENVKTESLYVTCNKQFTFRNGLVRDYLEFDKFVDNAELENVVIKRKTKHDMGASLQGATGVNNLLIKGCEIEGGIRVSPRRLTVENTNFKAVDNYKYGAYIERYNDFFPIDEINIKNVSVSNFGKSDAKAVLGFINVNKFSVNMPRGANSFTVSDDKNTFQTFLRSIDYSQRILSKENNVAGVVTEMFKEKNYWRIVVDWDKPLTKATKTILWTSAQKINVQNTLKTHKSRQLRPSKRKEEQNFLERLQLVE